MSQEILAQMAAALAKGDWALLADCASKMAQATAPDSPKKAAKKTAKKLVLPPSPPPETTFTNRFVDDRTLEKAHIISDKKLLKGIKPTTRRPPSDNRPKEVFCPKCNKPHMVAGSLVALRRETDSGMVCPSCLRSNRR